MPPTCSVRHVLTGHTLHIAALAGLLAPLGACEGEQRCVSTNEFGGVAVNDVVDFCYSGPASSGDGTDAQDVVREGIVRNDARGWIVVDSCQPNATCPPTAVLTLSGTDLSVSIPDGTFVQLDLRVVGVPECLWDVRVRNLPIWGGMPNPSSDGTFLWLVHSHIVNSTPSLPGDPYDIEVESLCRTQQKFLFSFPDAPGAEVSVPPGQTVTWSVPEGEHAGQYRVRVLQAMFIPTEGEPTSGYNYWIARK